MMMMMMTTTTTCLVPRPHYSARPKRFGSRGPSENVRHRQKSSKVRLLVACSAGVFWVGKTLFVFIMLL